MGREAPELGHAATPEVSLHIAASDQVPPYLRPLTMARNPAMNPSSPTWRRMSLMKMNTQRFFEDNAEALRNGQVGSNGDEDLGHSQI